MPNGISSFFVSPHLNRKQTKDLPENRETLPFHFDFVETAPAYSQPYALTLSSLL
jgi:hypothetical protein